MPKTETLYRVVRIGFIAYNTTHFKEFFDKNDFQIQEELKRIYPDYKMVSCEEGYVSLHFVQLIDSLKTNRA